MINIIALVKDLHLLTLVDAYAELIYSKAFWIYIDAFTPIVFLVALVLIVFTICSTLILKD